MQLFRRSVFRVCLLGLALPALAAASDRPAVDGARIHAKGGADPAAAACASCHNADALGIPAAAVPRLAGLQAAYLAKQLADFRAGTRIDPMMQPIARALSEAEIQAVSQTLSALPAPAYPTDAPTAESLGATLALRGDPAGKVPACVSCHGPGGVGLGDDVPPLVGQGAPYLKAQLDAWRQGTRKNDEDDLMGSVARALSEEQAQAVVDYFAGMRPLADAIKSPAP